MWVCGEGRQLWGYVWQAMQPVWAGVVWGGNKEVWWWWEGWELCVAGRQKNCGKAVNVCVQGNLWAKAGKNRANCSVGCVWWGTVGSVGWYGVGSGVGINWCNPEACNVGAMGKWQQSTQSAVCNGKNVWGKGVAVAMCQVTAVCAQT